jgi:hypothetical protein
MLTHLNGRLLNVTELAHSMELSTTAVGHYLDILEGSLMVLRLQPFFANTGKRLWLSISATTWAWPSPRRGGHRVQGRRGSQNTVGAAFLNPSPWSRS